MYKVTRDFEFYDDKECKAISFYVGNEINYDRKDDKMTIYYIGYNGFTCTVGADFDIEEYIEPIEDENKIKAENKLSKHLQVLQFDNLHIMNKELEKINEDDVVSIRPVNVIINNEDTIYYVVIIRK